MGLESVGFDQDIKGRTLGCQCRLMFRISSSEAILQAWVQIARFQPPILTCAPHSAVVDRRSFGRDVGKAFCERTASKRVWCAFVSLN